jgi:hypothetical protein
MRDSEARLERRVQPHLDFSQSNGFNLHGAPEGMFLALSKTPTQRLRDRWIWPPQIARGQLSSRQISRISTGIAFGKLHAFPRLASLHIFTPLRAQLQLRDQAIGR